MGDPYREALSKQFEAALCALSTCVERCPDEVWESSIGDARFDQIAFHTLIYTDLYLDTSEESARAQRFHADHASAFADYEEWEAVKPAARYERAFLLDYVRHCRAKARRVIESESDAMLAMQCSFDWLELTRFELHLYNTRHIQHHSGQLAMRLRMDAGIGVPWISSGWKNA